MSTSAPQVISAEAEAACALLFRTLSAHRLAVARHRPRPRSRLRLSEDGDAVQDRCQATLIRLLSVTEAFAAEMLSREVDEAIVGSQSAVATKVADYAVIGGTGGWDNLERSYKEWLGVRLNWKVVGQLAEARNAIAHGLGRLTRQQMRREQSVKSKLKAVGIVVDDNRIVLSDESLASVATLCRDFIERLDGAIQSRT